MRWFRQREAFIKGHSALDMRQFTPQPTAGYLVGGAVRDTLLGLPVRDYDWLVARPQNEAERTARLLAGRAFVLDIARDHWRVVSGSVTHDYAPLGGLEANLRARDYTIDAIAADLGGTLTDPTGGLNDLRAKQLRLISRENLWADPLRGLRGVRLATTLELKLERATEKAIHAHAAALARGVTPLPAWERVGDELTRLLLSERAAAGFLRLHHCGLLRAFLPELAEADGVTQGGFHHLDVLQHSLEALHQLLLGFPDADLPLRWGTLLHDVGKSRTKSLDDAGHHYHFYGHDKLGGELAQTLLRRLRIPNDVAERSAELIRYHMLPLPKNEREARRFVHRRRALLPNLLKLMIADREAARGPLSSEASRKAYQLALARVLEVMNEAPPQSPLLDGNEVMRLLGLTPGPRVGEAVRFVHEAEAVGDVRTRTEAEAALRNYAHRQGWLD